jgi:hypothetical protein
MLSLRHRYIFFTGVSLLFVFFIASYLRGGNSYANGIFDHIPGTSPPAPPPKYQPKYKPTPPATSFPIADNFPLAAAAYLAADLPPIPEWNRPPTTHIPEKTPLFIGFTRNWRILQQVVVSYITAGWPPSDIYVVENTGVMDSNKRGLLSLQNPFFLNHTRLNMLGVNILVAPTLLTFAQLQNYYLYTSIEKEWDYYFWSHMDVVAVSFEGEYIDQKAESHKVILPPSDPKHDYSDFKSLYMNCVDNLRNITHPDPQTGKVPRWAQRFFSYDRLALVNVAAFVEVGGWDTLIPFYMTDCDMHARLEMAKFEMLEVHPGFIFDVASSLDDLIVLYRKKNTVEPSFKDPNAVEEELKAIAQAEKEVNDEKSSKREERDWNLEADKEFSAKPANSGPSNGKWEDDEIHSERFTQIEHTLDSMLRSKGESARGRNTWQARQTGGQGDPFYRDSAGFDIGIQMTIEHGRAVFREKWGHRDCDLRAIGLMPDDAWKVEHDWR